MKDKLIWLFLVLVIGWFGGYAHHYLATKGNPGKTTVVILGCGEVKYARRVDAIRERMALGILGMKTEWEEVKE